MVVFWIVAAAMTGVALAFVLVPLLRARAGAAPSAGEANLDVLRSQRREIEADVAAGVLPADAREEALRELVARAETELPHAPEKAAAPVRRPWIVVAVAGVLLPAIAVGLYLRIGEPRGLDPAATRAAQAAPHEGASDPQIVAMVETLAAKVRARPDDVQGWSLLARSMNALGRCPEAVDAYEHLAKLVPDNPDVLADWADALGMKNGRNLQGKPYEMVKQALKIDPAHQKALALAGTAAMSEGDYTASIAYWQALAKVVPPGSEDQQKVAAIIEEVRGRAAAAGSALPPGRAVAQAPKAPPAAPPAKAAAAVPAAGASTVSGTVSIAPALASKVAITDSLFIFARAEGGPRVPLAVLRGGARELPKDFVLDDSMAMAPGMNLSTAGPVRIEARVSKSGNATPQPGDLVGSSAVVKPGARDVKIVIDRALP